MIHPAIHRPIHSTFVHYMDRFIQPLFITWTDSFNLCLLHGPIHSTFIHYMDRFIQPLFITWTDSFNLCSLHGPIHSTFVYSLTKPSISRLIDSSVDGPIP